MREKSTGRLSFRAMEVFVAAIEERSITKAAKRLGSSVSAVSLQLSNLETALGARLIERLARRFELTDAGRLFRQRALRVLDEIDGAKADLSMKSRSPRMIVRLAIIEDFDLHVLPLWLTLLEEKFSNLRFIVKSGPNHESHAILNSRSADMIVAVDAMDTVDWVEEHPLLQDPYLLVTSPDITLDPSVEDLSRRPFIRYAREQHMGRQIEAQLRRTKFLPPRAHEFTSSQAVFAMVLASGGWAITTASALAGTPVASSDTANLCISRLPIPAFCRVISLYARRDVLGDLPDEFAGALRQSLNQTLHVPKLVPAHRSPQLAQPRVLDENSDLYLSN